MTVTEFRDLLDAYGPDWSQWLEADRIAAQKLLRDEAAARAAFAEAEALHRLLGGALGKGEASAGLRARIADIPRQHPQARAERGSWLGALLQPWRIGLVATTISAVLGVVIGLATAPPPRDEFGMDLPGFVYWLDEDDLS